MAYQVAKYKRGTRQRFEMPTAPTPGTPEFSRLLTAMTGAVPRLGNRVRIMHNGATLDAMLDAISSAKETIDCSSYIYWPGGIADRFSEAFIDRVRAGVEVNLVLDGYGSAKLDAAHVERLRHAGVHVSLFRPLRWFNLKKLNNRMHRRILVVDGTLAFAGGVGIADVWTGDAQDPEHWRETHLRIEGPAVVDLFGAFLENWTEATGGLLAGTHIAEAQSFEDGVALHVTRSTPTGGATAATELFYAAIAGARERLWLTTAYFAPDRTFEEGPLRRRSARRRRPRLGQRPRGRQRGRSSSRASLLRQVARSRCQGVRVRQDDDARQGSAGRPGLGQRRVGELRQPVARSRSRDQRGRPRPRPGRRVEPEVPRGPGRVEGVRSGDVEAPTAAKAGQRVRDRDHPPVDVIPRSTISSAARTAGR